MYLKKCIILNYWAQNSICHLIKFVQIYFLWKWRCLVTQWGLTLCDAYQDPQSMGFSRQEYWSGLPFPSPGDLPNPGMEPGSLALQADSLLSKPPEKLSYFLLSTFVCFICLFWKWYVKISQLWLRIVNFFFVIPSIFSINILRTC